MERLQANQPPHLLVATPAGTQEFTLDRDRLVLGREPGVDILVDDRVVSRRHAELRRSGAGYEIVDLGSMNGLVAEGRRIRQKALLDGEQIRIGDSVTLTYRASAAKPAWGRGDLSPTVMEAAPMPGPPPPPDVISAPQPALYPPVTAPQPPVYPPPVYASPNAVGPPPPTYQPPVAWGPQQGAYPPGGAYPSPGIYPPPRYGGPVLAPQAAAAAPTATGGLKVSVVPLIGGILVAVSSLLPWFASFQGGKSSNAFEVPVGYLIDPLKGQGGLKVGILVVLIGLVGALLACLPVRRAALVTLGTLATVFGGVFVVQTIRFVNAVNQGAGPGGKVSATSVIGLGAYLAVVGGVLMMIKGKARRPAAPPAPPPPPPRW